MEYSVQLPEKQTIADHLAGMIPFRTIAFRDQSKTEAAPFEGLHAYLQKTYPLVHASLQRTVIGAYSLLYHWKGTGKSAEKPILLMAHQDVVPVPEETLDQWHYPPFEGIQAEGMVWGRGSLDCKNMLCCELEAIEALLNQGYTPKRDIYLAFGHDEESGGFNGMTAVAAYLKEQGVMWI
ncbi:MAG: M20/M25/M40 family metallo-hydrolase [Christensenellales bacterium]